MDELVELERVDLAGVVTLEALSHMFEQPRELGLVIGADGSASRSPFRLRRTGLRACPAVGIAGRYRLRTLLGDWRAGGHDGTDLSGRTATTLLDGQSHAKASHEPLDGAAARAGGWRESTSGDGRESTLTRATNRHGLLRRVSVEPRQMRVRLSKQSAART